MAAQMPADVQMVADFIKGFEYTPALQEESTQQSLRSQLQEAQKAAAQKQADCVTEIERARELSKEAQVSQQEATDAEQAAEAELSSKAEVLAAEQVELESAKTSHKDAEKAGAQDAKDGRQLREAKAKNVEVTRGAFKTLLEGTWGEEEAKTTALQLVQEYLEELRAEKALVAAVPGVGVMPEERGEFDKATVESISEVLAEKLRETEEVLAARAPAEKEAKTELMGLSALVDICQEKVQAATAEHAAAEAALKASKTALKPLRSKVAKLEKSMEALLASQSREEKNAQSATEALAALERLCQAAEAASKEAPVQAEAAVVEGCEKPEGAEADEVAEPDSKRARVEKPAGLSVASPARATRSRLSMPSRPAETA